MDLPVPGRPEAAPQASRASSGRLGATATPLAVVACAVLLALPAPNALATPAPATAVTADGQTADDPVEMVAQRIRRLQEEIGRLLDTLDPEQREAVRARLSELAAGAPEAGAPEAAKPEATKPEATKPEATKPEAVKPGTASPETASPETASPETASPETDSPKTAAPTADRAPQAIGCRTLAPFDADGDGKLTALDRYWRHFYLWTDGDGDGRASESELFTPYDRGIREIAIHLRSFVRGKGKKARGQEILIDDLLILDIADDGFGGAIPRGDDGALAVDASALARAGGPRWLDARGQPVEGVAPLRAGGHWQLPDGTRIEIDCP